MFQTLSVWEQGRDKITIVNRNFKNVAEAGVSNMNNPAETPVINVPAETSVPVAEHSQTKVFGIISLILAAIFLVVVGKDYNGKKMITD